MHSGSYIWRDYNYNVLNIINSFKVQLQFFILKYVEIILQKFVVRIVRVLLLLLISCFCFGTIFNRLLLQLMLHYPNNISSLYSYTEENFRSKNLPVPSEYLKNGYSYCSSSSQLSVLFHYLFHVEKKQSFTIQHQEVERKASLQSL